MLDIREEIGKALFEYRKNVIDVRDSMNKAYLDYRTNSLIQRRDLWKFVATISLAILGLSSFILERSYHHVLTSISLVLYGVLVALIIFYLREILDFEDSELQKQQDRYNVCSEEALEIVDTYIEGERFTKDDHAKFWAEISSTESAKALKTENESLKDARMKRNEQADYFGETIVFILASASFLMILGSVKDRFSIPIISFSFVLLFGLSFSNLIMRSSRVVSKGVSFLKKNIF